MSVSLAAAEHQRQAFPITPSQHAELLHPVKHKGGAKGRVVLARKLVKYPWWEEKESWQPYELDAVLWDAADECDRYITQNRFSGERRLVAQLQELSALYSDVDFYDVPELRNLAPESILRMALQSLYSASIPEPSLGLCSGRGICIVWRHTTVTREELPIWNACQDGLYKLLKPLGADIRSRDAARVLRLVGTVNSKNGASVYCLRDAAEQVYRFEDLAESLSLVSAQQDEVGDQERTADLYSLQRPS